MRSDIARHPTNSLTWRYRCGSPRSICAAAPRRPIIAARVAGGQRAVTGSSWGGNEARPGAPEQKSSQFRSIPIKRTQAALPKTALPCPQERRSTALTRLSHEEHPMPFLRVDAYAGRSKEQVTELLDAIHRAVLSAFGVPARDRYQACASSRTISSCPSLRTPTRTGASETDGRSSSPASCNRNFHSPQKEYGK
jgi:hypothetical protein